MALTCLLDTSVWNRLDRAPALATEVTALLRHSEVGDSDIERLEVLRSARHTDHYRRLVAMFAALPKVALTEAALLRAGQVGSPRGISPLGSHGTERDSLPSFRSSHPIHENARIHAQ